jgi:hypothetical protein
MTTFIIAVALFLAIRAFHRFVMRSVDSHGHIAPITEEPRQHYRGYLGHQEFKSRHKV